MRNEKQQNAALIREEIEQSSCPFRPQLISKSPSFVSNNHNKSSLSHHNISQSVMNSPSGFIYSQGTQMSEKKNFLGSANLNQTTTPKNNPKIPLTFGTAASDEDSSFSQTGGGMNNNNSRAGTKSKKQGEITTSEYFNVSAMNKTNSYHGSSFISVRSSSNE